MSTRRSPAGQRTPTISSKFDALFTAAAPIAGSGHWVTGRRFTGDIADPERLITWVDQRRGKDLGPTTIDTLELVRFRYDDEGPFMRPETLAKARLAHSR